MRILSGVDEKKALEFIAASAEIAKSATCLRSKCGSVIVKDDVIIGKGYNSPAYGDELQRRCLCEKDSYHKKVTDKTCCIHAEQRAIIDALKTSSEVIEGSRLYFIRLDEAGNISRAGEPYCTICSKLALDVGISEFVLLKQEGICVYDTKEYNLLSFEFKG